VRVKAKNESGKEQYAFDYYVSDGSVKNYGIICFYVTEAGTIEVDTYDE
jgi:spore coat protein H